VDRSSRGVFSGDRQPSHGNCATAAGRIPITREAFSVIGSRDSSKINLNEDGESGRMRGGRNKETQVRYIEKRRQRKERKPSFLTKKNKR